MAERAPKVDEDGSVVVDDRTYARVDLSERARGLVDALRHADQEIARAQALAAMLNVARQSYAAALRAELAAADAASGGEGA